MEVGRKMTNMLETELCLGLPGGGGTGTDPVETLKATGKRGFSETVDLKLNLQSKEDSIKNTIVSKENSSCTKDPAKPPAK